MQEQHDAIDAAREAAQAAVPRGFDVQLNLPLFYNSNSTEVPSGPGAPEIDPQIATGWSRGLALLPLRLNARLAADADRYPSAPQADEDEASVSLKAQYYARNDDQAWAPFASYQRTLLSAPAFAMETEARDDFALGFAKIFAFDGGLRPLPPSGRSLAGAVWMLGVTVAIQRRLRSPPPDSSAIIVAPSITWVPVRGWSVELIVDTRQRWFESLSLGPGIISPREFTMEPILTIAYDPEAALYGLGVFGAPQLALQVGFERRSSNLPDKSWNQWTVGPVLTASWRF